MTVAAIACGGGSADVVLHRRSGDGRQDPAPDSGPLRAHHRPGQSSREPRWQARQFRFTDTPTTRRSGPPENTRPPRSRPFGPHTEQNSLCSLIRNGYVLRGRVRVRRKDDDEVVKAGDVYHFEPGHVPVFEEDTEVLEFSPKVEYQKTIDVLSENVAAAPPN